MIGAPPSATSALACHPKSLKPAPCAATIIPFGEKCGPAEARARKLELENGRLERDLVSKEAAVEAGQHFAAHVRAGLLSFGPSIAASLVGLPADTTAMTVAAALRDVLGRLGDPQDFIFDRELA